MRHCLSVIFPLLAFIGLHASLSEDSIERTFVKLLEVTNGLNFGRWGKKEFCPEGTFAAGFSLQVETPLYFNAGDDTALNGIRLHCISASRDSSKPYIYSVQSETGSWGDWTGITWCPSGFLTGFQLRVECFKEIGDNTAANNIRFNCSDGSILEGKGTDWGDWGSWSPMCGTGRVCGLQTSVEEPQGITVDDTALNDVRMFCCS